MKNIVGEEFKSNSHKVKAEKAAEKLPDKKVKQKVKLKLKRNQGLLNLPMYL